MSSKQRINRAKFLEIKRLVEGTEAMGRYNAEAIAEATGVGNTTVRQVRRAKTWPRYQQLNANYAAARKGKRSDRPAAGVRPSPSQPEQQDMFAKRVELSQEDYDTLMALIPTVKQLKEWHDSYQKLAESVAEEALRISEPGGNGPEVVKVLERSMSADDGPSTVNGHYPVFNEQPAPQPKKKLLGIFGGRK